MWAILIFIVLIDVSRRWYYTSLLSTRNLVFTKLLTQIIILREQFSNYLICPIDLIMVMNLHLNHLMIIAEQLMVHKHTYNGLE